MEGSWPNDAWLRGAVAKSLKAECLEH
jgi:hypothetical protein